MVTVASDPSWLPTPAEVGVKMGRFLPDLTGTVDGTFSTDTSPTVDQVTSIIRSTGLALNAAATAGGAVIDGSLEDLAKDAVAYRAAARTILSFYPEITRADGGMKYIEQLEAWGDELLTLINVNTDDGADPEVEFVDIVEFNPRPGPELTERVWPSWI